MIDANPPDDWAPLKFEDPTAKDLVDDEMINHPSHYTNGKIECIDYIEDQKFGYHVGAAVKYCARYRYKGTPVMDLRKAAWYLLRKADKLEGEQKNDRDNQTRVAEKASVLTTILKEPIF